MCIVYVGYMVTEGIIISFVVALFSQYIDLLMYYAVVCNSNGRWINVDDSIILHNRGRGQQYNI